MNASKIRVCACQKKGMISKILNSWESSDTKIKIWKFKNWLTEYLNLD